MTFRSRSTSYLPLAAAWAGALTLALPLLFGCAPPARTVAATPKQAVSSESIRRGIAYVWIECNALDPATNRAPAWLSTAIERYRACGLHPIVTTSPGTDYLPIYDGLPEDVIYGAKLSNALPADPDDEAGWRKIADGIAAYANLRVSQIRELGGDPSGVVSVVILEGETYLQRNYWRSPEPAAFRDMLARRLRALPTAHVSYVWYPGIGWDYYQGFAQRLRDLLLTVNNTLPRVRYTDSQFAYRSINPTWNHASALILVQYAARPTLSLVYTDTFTYQGSGFARIGWPPAEVPAELESIRAQGRNPVLYPGGTESQFTAPLAELEASQ